MLRLLNEIVQAIDVRGGNDSRITYQGRDCFKYFYKKLKGKWDKNIDSQEGSNRAIKAYELTFPEIEADVGHYFRSLYNIVKFVDQSVIENKRLYTNLVRAQISSYELVLLFYNCLPAYGKQKFKPLVEEYSLLKMISPELLLNPESDKLEFNAKAFDGSPELQKHEVA